MSKPKWDAERWKDLCERASNLANVESLNYPDDINAELAEEAAERLLAEARWMRGVACPSCSGVGRKGYASTSTWRGGIGGMAITDDVCDKCWGTGRTDRTGANLRKILNGNRD